MKTETGKNVIGILGRYFHPLKAQYIVEQYCDRIDLSVDNFSVENMPKFILHLAKDRDNLSQIDDKQFFSMLSNLVNLAFSLNKDKDALILSFEGKVRKRFQEFLMGICEGIFEIRNVSPSKVELVENQNGITTISLQFRFEEEGGRHDL